MEGTCPLKFGKKIFSGNYYVKFGHFSGKNSVKFGNFVNFSEKYYKNSGRPILLFFSGKDHVKFGHFVIFFNFHTYFRAKMSCPLNLTELLRLWTCAFRESVTNKRTNKPTNTPDHNTFLAEVTT